MTKPVRLQLSRRKGFDLRALSLATNGLPAVNVTRPHRWHNIYVVTEDFPPGTELPGGKVAVSSRQQAVISFREMLEEDPEIVTNAVEELKGKNLACWCQDDICHAAVLLEVVNE